MPADPLRSLPKIRAAFIEPMECALVSKLPEGPDWTYEVKLDGYRAIGVRTGSEAILYSRNQKNFNKRYPRVAEALRDLPPETVIDGEVVALDLMARLCAAVIMYPLRRPTPPLIPSNAEIIELTLFNSRLSRFFSVYRDFNIFF